MSSILDSTRSDEDHYYLGDNIPLSSILDSTRNEEDHYYLGGKIVIGGELVAQDFFSFLVLYNYIIPIRNVVLP